MKKILTICSIALAAVGLNGQGIVDKYYSELESEEKTTSIYVSSAMFEMAAKLDIESDDKDFNDMKEFVNSVKSFSLIKVPELVNPISYYKDGVARIEGTHTELVRVKDEDTRISVYVDEEDDVIYEVAVLGVVDGDFLAASLIGEMDMDRISNFINKVEGEKFSGLSALKEAGATEMKVYPNPAAKGAEFTIEVPNSLVGGSAMIYDMYGNQVEKRTLNDSRLTVSTLDFAAGSYVVELVKGEVSVKQKMLILE